MYTIKFYYFKMNYKLLKELLSLVEEFESANNQDYESDLAGFKLWIYDLVKEEAHAVKEPNWEGKEMGRSPESIISTLIVHLNRYAKTYSKSAILDSPFSTQEEFIYLINLKAFGAMTKMELIKRNIQEKPVGMQIINRLLNQGWIEQFDSSLDKRSKIIQITPKGLSDLEKQMSKIRQATQIVAGDLSRNEKMELIRLLNKLNDFHQPIFLKNIHSSELLERVSAEMNLIKN